ncbi:MAG: argininosuccinate lyase [Kiloniellaceae bacterium]
MEEKAIQEMTTGATNGSGQENAGRFRGGRYEQAAASILERINASIGFDHRLAKQDIAGSVAHVTMLGRQGILADADVERIQGGLDQVLDEIISGRTKLLPELEDIHMNVEARLSDLIGPSAGRLHTARSRNDQVATDFKLWTREASETIDVALSELVLALVDKADRHADTLMPGFTHLQCAQPVTFGHHCLAYAEMFMRDRDRYLQGARRLNECPLGAAALAGTSFPIDRDMTARLLGFDRPTANSLDSVSDRDFALDFLATSAIAASHLSRLAEELVIWSSAQFRFVTMPEELTAGSSIMPQKRNPDAAELVRAKSGRIYGNLMTLLTVLKGLPLAYGKDLQEDKEPVFDSFDSLALCIEVMTALVRGLEVNSRVMKQAAGDQHSTATDLADWMVRTLDMPFREAHGIVGQLVRLADQRGCGLADLSLDTLRDFAAGINEEAQAVLTAQYSVESRKSMGGTAPAQVQVAANSARQRNAALDESARARPSNMENR